MRITRITAIAVRVPVPRARIHCPAFFHEPLNRGPGGGWDGPWFADVPNFVVKVEGDGGPAGWSDLVRLQDEDGLRRLAERFIGLDHTQIDARLGLVESPWARGLHTAALDWRARIEEKPLYRLFGERVRERVPVATWGGFRTSAGAARIAAADYAAGHRCLKLKAGLETDDPAIAAAVHAATGDDQELVIDPNGRWETPEETRRRAAAIVTAHPQSMLEDPIWYDPKVMYGDEALASLAAIRRETGIGMAVTVKALDQLLAATRAEAVTAVNVEGTWPALLERFAAASRLGLPAWAGSSVQSGLSDLAMLHFAVTQPAFTCAFEMAGAMYREDDLVVEPVPLANGWAAPPELPGTGVTPDEAAIERYRAGEPVVIRA